MSRLLPIFLILLNVSCGGDSWESPDSPLPEDDGISVSIELAGQPGNFTRAENDEYGSIADNYINYEDLYVMTFSIEEGETVLTNESRLLEVVWHPDYSKGTYNGKSMVSSNGETIYLTALLNNTFSEYQNGKDFCLVAVANIKSFSKTLSFTTDLTPGKTLAQLRERLKLDFGNSTSQDWSWCPDNTKKIGIPMFGVKRVNLKGYDSKIFSPWNPYELQSNGSKTMHLIRSFSKVVIGFRNDFTPPGGMDVKFVSGGGINKYSDKFYVIPTLERMEGFNSKCETGQIKFEYNDILEKEEIVENLENDISNNGDSDKSLLQFTASPDGKYAYLYLPEYEFEMEDSEKPEFTLFLSFGGGDPQKFNPFTFKDYYPTPAESEETEEPEIPIYWKYILRNYSYQYTIGVRFWEISIETTDWNDVKNNIFDF